MDLEKKVISVIKENIKYNDEIKLDDGLIEDLGVDSLEKLMIIYALEDEYSIRIEDDDVNNLQTVSDIVTKLREKI